MRIFIRSDASLYMGAGHVMRCLALAEEARDQGVSVGFLCREHPGNLIEQLTKKGFQVHPLPVDQGWTPQVAGGDGMSGHAKWLGTDWETDAFQVEAILARECGQGPIDWLIVDHYALDARWERRMRPYVKKIMVIDDLADRSHDCDLLLDQNFYLDMDARYDGLAPEGCQKLLGPKYSLLRREFQVARQNLRQRTGEVNRILVFFAGADPTNETAKVLKGIQLLNLPEIAVDVVVAKINSHKEQIRQLTAAMPSATFYCQPANLAELMAKADLSIGASGSTTWERCCLGLPTLVVPLAANQQAISRDLAEFGAAFTFGSSEEMRVEDYVTGLRFLLRNPAILKDASDAAKNLVDGQGVRRSFSALRMDRVERKKQDYSLINRRADLR